MKFILGIICWCVLNTAFSQADSIRFYRLKELTGCNPDTVYAISLSKEKLTELPDAINAYTHLRYLDIGRNKLTDLSAIGQFKELIYLNVEKNGLMNFPVVVCQLPKLEVLVANRNNFAYIPPCINYCTDLRDIDLWYTAVTALPDEMMMLRKLETIDFSGVRMSPTEQERLKDQFPKVNLKLDAPCDCFK